MTIRTRSTAAKWNVFFHMASMFITSIAGLVTLPINLSHIEISMFGAWLATGNIIAWATMIDPGLSAVTQQRVGAAYGARDLVGVGKCACVGISLNLTIALLISFVGATLVWFIPSLLGLEGEAGVRIGEIQRAALLAVVGLFFNVSAYAVTSTNLAMLGSVFIGFTYLLSLLIGIGLQIYLVMTGWGVVGIALGHLTRGLVSFTGGLGYLVYRFVHEHIRFQYDRAEARKTIGLTSFTFMSKGVGAIADNLDSFLVVRLMAPEAAAILRSTRAPVAMCVGLTNRPSAAVAPILANIAGAGELGSKQKQIQRLALFSLWITSLSFVGLVALLEAFIGLWVGAEFFAGKATMWVLCLGMLALSGSAYAVNMAFAIGEIKRTALITTGRAVIILIGMTIFGYLYGLPGVASGAGLGAIFSFCLAGGILLKTKAISSATMGVLGKEIFWLFITVLAVYLLSNWLPPINSWPQFILSAFGVVFLFAVLMLLLSRRFRSEIVLGMQFIGKKLKLVA